MSYLQWEFSVTVSLHSFWKNFTMNIVSNGCAISVNRRVKYRWKEFAIEFAHECVRLESQIQKTPCTDMLSERNQNQNRTILFRYAFIYTHTQNIDLNE